MDFKEKMCVPLTGFGDDSSIGVRSANSGNLRVLMFAPLHYTSLYFNFFIDSSLVVFCYAL